jgi:hypothetical protein
MGEPTRLRMPVVMGVKLTGALPPWVSAKDIILEILRRHGLEGGFGRVIEYYGPGLAQLSAMDRHVIANMGAELERPPPSFPPTSAHASSCGALVGKATGGRSAQSPAPHTICTTRSIFPDWSR